MADFRAKITADADLKNATSAIDSFVNQTRKLTVDVDLKLTNAGQNLANILNQLQGQAKSAGSAAGGQFVSSFNGSLGNINVAATANQLANLQKTLSGLGFDNKAIGNVTKDIDNMGVAVTNIQAKMSSKGGLSVNVKGVDQLGRDVTVVRNYDKAAQSFNTTLTTTAKAEKMVSASQIQVAKNNLTTWANKNSKAVEAFGGDIKTFQDDMQKMIDNGGATSSEFKAVTDGIKVMKSEANASGNIGKTFSESFGNAFNSMVKFAASYVTIRKVFQELKNGIQTVISLDDALVDLQKTTTATPQQLNAFYNEANGIAKQYGTTTQQIIQGAADWSRLGYSLEDSKQMAKLSSQFAAISPGMNVEESTNSLVSTMKAFGIEADSVLDGIMSKVNVVGIVLPKRMATYGV